MKIRLFFGFLFLCVLPIFSQNLYQYKTKIIEKDNFVWYRVQTELGVNHTGALSESGEIIIPTEFLSVEYKYGFFDVTKSIGDHTFYYGVYTKTGNCIIPVSRGYTHIMSFNRATDHDEYKYHEVGKGNKRGICNHYGMEIVPVIYQDVKYNVDDNTCEVITNTGEVKVIDVGTNDLPTSRSSKSSSSSSSRQWVPCFFCDGTGNCPDCGGTGMRSTPFGMFQCSPKCGGCGGAGGSWTGSEPTVVGTGGNTINSNTNYQTESRQGGASNSSRNSNNSDKGWYTCCSNVANFGNVTYHTCANCGKRHQRGSGHMCKRR